MDNNIPDTGHLQSSKLYPKGAKKGQVSNKEKDKDETVADQVTLSGEAKAKSMEAKKVNEWVDMLKNMPEDEDRIAKGKEALKKFQKNPNDMIKLVADNIRDEWSLTD